MNGIVSLLAVKKGERVAGNSFNVGTEMMRIADMRSIEVRVDVGENDIPKVKLGDAAMVQIDAYSNRKFAGVVYKIANPNTIANVNGSSTDVTNYKVHIRLLESSYKDLIVTGKSFPFRPNMSASADIQTKTKKDVISVALNAVTTRDSKSDTKKETTTTATTTPTTPVADALEEVVFVLQKDGKVKKVKVSTDIQDLNNIEITKGLKIEDEVIVGPYNVVSKSLKDGDKVKVVAKDKLYDDGKKS